MNILHVLPSLDQKYGGPVRAVLDLSSKAFDAGLHSEVLGFGPMQVPDNPFPSEFIHSLPIGFPSRYCYSPQLRPWLRAHLDRFDGVVLHGMWLYPNWAIARECRVRRRPYACFPHGMLEPWAVNGQGLWKAQKKIRYWNWRERKVFERACCVFFTTRREREQAARTFSLQGMQLILVPYGVDVAPKKTVFPSRDELLQPPGRRVALFLGRVHPKKNVDFLIEAWHKAELSRDWHLLIAGPGDPHYLDALRRLIQRLHVETQVHLAGFVSGEDKSYLLQRAHWFLLPSSQENFGVAVIEAIAHGCPVAISDQVSVAESFHEKSEILPLDMACWVRFLRERMTDERGRAELIRADRGSLIDAFHIDKISAAWASTLQAVFGEARA